LGPLNEPEIIPLTAEEMNVTPQGQVLLLPDAVSAFDHVKQQSKRLSGERETAAPAAEALRKTVRLVAGIRELEKLPEPEVTPSESMTIHQQRYEAVVLRVADDIWLPGLLARPDKQSNPRVTCLIMAEGKNAMIADGGEVSRRVADGETVLAIDIRGIGETKPVGQKWYHQRFGDNGGNATLAYLLGKSLVGDRAEDVLTVARWLAKKESVDSIQLVASGELTIPALHAAAVEPQLFSSLELQRGLVSWTNLVETPMSVNQVAGLVHNALDHYDLPELAGLFDGKLTITDPHDATDQLIQR
jgi:hypothetical protein